MRILPLLLAGSALAQDLYDGCAVADYYANITGDVLTWTRDELADLVTSTVRNIVPYTGGEDVWTALADLDMGVENETVKLIYSLNEVPVFPRGAGAWRRHHLWARGRGIERDTPEFTDMHHIRAADDGNIAVRGDLFFGRCGLFAPADACVTPASPDAANDTAVDGTIFLPPASVLGDIARSLLYMAVRYPNLVLSDCPSSATEMAYLSQLLEWHALDGPDDAERARNDRICTHWQGNRNIFIDFPPLATSIFGAPEVHPEDGSIGYPSCPAPTQAPSLSPAPSASPVPSTSPSQAPSNMPSPLPSATPSASPTVSQAPSSGPSLVPTFQENSCSAMTPGGLGLLIFNSEDPDTVVFFVLDELPEGLELYMTDNAWTGTEFLVKDSSANVEGTLKLTVPSRTRAGRVIGYNDEATIYYDMWEEVQGRFSLSQEGDSIITYCYLADGSINFISAMTYSEAGWADPGRPDYTEELSALPEQLQEFGGLALPHLDNYFYNGLQAGFDEQLRAEFVDPDSFVGSNDDRYDYSAAFWKGWVLTLLCTVAPLLVWWF